MFDMMVKFHFPPAVWHWYLQLKDQYIQLGEEVLVAQHHALSDALLLWLKGVR